MAEPVLRARQRLRSTSPGSRSPTRCSRCCRRSKPRSRRSRARPHWGKLFVESPRLEAVYPQLRRSAQLRARLDPDRDFAQRVRRRASWGCRRRRPGSARCGPASPRSSASIAWTSSGLQLEVEERRSSPGSATASSTSGRRCCRAGCASAGRPARRTCRRCLGDLGQRRVVEHLALRDRRPRLGRDPVRASVGVDLAVLEVRMELDLVDGRHASRLGGEALEMRDLEVRDADRPRAAVGLELLERLPGRDEVAVVERRQRPVDEEQVDVVEAKRRRASASNARRASSGRWKPLFSLLVTKTSLRVEAARADRFADALLVAVHLCRVDVPVAGLEGVRHRLRGLGAAGSGRRRSRAAECRSRRSG